MDTLLQVYLWHLEVGLIAGGFIVAYLAGRSYGRNRMDFTRWRRIGWYLTGAIAWFPIGLYALAAYLMGCMQSQPFYFRR